MTLLPPPPPEMRPAVHSDVPRLVALYQAAVDELATMRGGRVLLGRSGRPDPVPATFTDQIDDEAQQILVSWDAGVIVGYGSCRTHELEGSGPWALSGSPPARIGSIEDLYVLPASRRRGIGRAITSALLEWCRAAGCTGTDAPALPGNRAMKSFFESAGFSARLLVMHRYLG